MPVQKKSRTADPGEKKKKNWIQIAVVAFIILVIVMCVLSFSNVSKLFDTTTGQGVSGGIISEGDPVAIYFSTNIGNQTTFAYAAEDVNTLQPLRIVADSNSSIEDNDYTSIMIGLGNTSIPYGIYATEKNAIAKAIVGKQYGETISVPVGFYAVVSCTADNLAAMGYDIADVKVGDIIPMSLGYTDILGNQDAYLRFGSVISINEDLSGVTMNCGSDTIDSIAVGKYSA